MTGTVAKISQQGEVTFFNTILDVPRNRGTKHETGKQILNGGRGHHTTTCVPVLL